MGWEDVLIDRPVDDAALARALAVTLGIAKDAVLIVDQIKPAPASVDRDVGLLVERVPARGDFAVQLSLYLLDPEIERRVASRGESVELLKQLACRLDRGVLIGDESLDPLSWLMINRAGTLMPVTLDADRLEKDEYVLASGRPFERRAESVA